MPWHNPHHVGSGINGEGAIKADVGAFIPERQRRRFFTGPLSGI